MDRGELDIQSHLDLMMREIYYQYIIAGREIFPYSFKNNERIGVYFDHFQQLDLLRALHNLKRIKCDIESAWPETPLYGADELVFKTPVVLCTIDVRDSVFDFIDQPVSTKQSKVHTASLTVRDTSLLLSVDGGEFQQIGRLKDGLEVHKLLTAVFSHPAGEKIRNTDIFTNGRAKNLRQVLQKSGYKYLEVFFDPTCFPRAISRKSDIVEIGNEELGKILSTINEKYRKNFPELI